MALMQGEKCICWPFEMPEMPRHYWNHPFQQWYKLPIGDYEETDVEMRAKLGKNIISTLPFKFRAENKGRFVAATFTGIVLAVCDTLEDLNKELVNKKINQNYYIERLGHKAIAQID